MKRIENNLKQFREIEPDEKFWHITKSVLLNQIEKDLSSNKQQRFNLDSLLFGFMAFSKTVFPGWKFVSVTMSVLVAISGTFIGARASMPGTTFGNILYPVKTQIIEPAELAFANTDVEKIKISLDHASNRLEEINYLIENRKEDQIDKVTDSMQESLTLANSNLKSIRTENNIESQELVELAKTINKNSDQTLESLKDKVIASNPKAIENIIKSTQQLNTTALEIMIKDNSNQEIVNKSLDNQIKLQLESVKKIGEKITIGEQTLIKTNELSTNSTNEQVNSESQSINSIADINKQEIEFSIESIKKLANPEQISLSIEKARQLLDEGKIEEAYVEIQKADLYINLADSTLDAQNYEIKIKELENAINKAQVKSVTEQISQ